MQALTGVTKFRISINMMKIALCLHGENPDPRCRACSIGLAMQQLGTVQWYNDEIDSFVRIIEGEVSTDEGRFALSRLIAFSQQHIDPIDLIALH